MADDSKQDRSLSEARTDWAERRTALAAERTFAAWGRTALSCIGVGSAHDLEGSGEHTLSTWWIGAFAVVLAAWGVAGVFLVW